MQVLIFGNGMVGQALYESLNKPGIVVGMCKKRIKSEEDILAELKSPVDVIVNCIGKTGKPNVDWCEDHKDEVYFSNVEVPRLMAKVAKEKGIRMVHISSGCVYSGGIDSPEGFSEKDPPNFAGSFYSFTKATVERLISNEPDVLTVRLRIPLLPSKSDRGILAKLMKYESIIETENSISYLPDFIMAMTILIKEGQTGIWNITNSGPITYRRVLEIFDEVNGTNVVATKKFIKPEELKTNAPRSNCILNPRKISDYLESLGVSFALTEDAVREAALAYNKK